MMEGPATYAIKRGSRITVAFVMIAFGFSAMQPSKSLNWPVSFAGSLGLGIAYATFVYFEVGPIQNARRN